MSTVKITCKKCLATRAFYASKGLIEYSYICKNCNDVEGFNGFYCPMYENVNIVFPTVRKEPQNMNCNIPCFCTTVSNSIQAAIENDTYNISCCEKCLPRS